MNKNIKIAKELVKLAKNLIAEQNIADKEGEYKNFTGIIDIRGNNGYAYGQVQDADFTVKNGIVYWHNGEWKSGRLENCTWENGVFKKGNWYGGTWKNGTFEHGFWQSGIWEKGKWDGGIWLDGQWENGNWKIGLDERGKKHYENPNLWHEYSYNDKHTNWNI